MDLELSCGEDRLPHGAMAPNFLEFSTGSKTQLRGPGNRTELPISSPEVEHCGSAVQ
jgi:hypothetical protein